MDKEEFKKIFHLLFNKINNICLAAGANKELLKQEELDKISSEELRQRVSLLAGALSKIEDNARSLNKALEGLYELLVKKKKS
jgi:hypothetical protein